MSGEEAPGLDGILPLFASSFSRAGEERCVLYPSLSAHRQGYHVPPVLQGRDTGRDPFVFPQQMKSTCLYRVEASGVGRGAGHPCQATVLISGRICAL